MSLTPEELAGLVVEAESERISHLAAENRRLQAKVKKLENRQEELYDATLKSVKDAVTLIDLPKVQAPKRDARKKAGETACVVLGDWQLGKTSTTYSTETCARRIALMAAKVTELTEIQRADHPVKDVHVWLIGDMVEGELIFPGQEHEIELSLFEQVLLHGPEILGSFLRSMLGTFESVTVSWCLGNHGRIGGRQSRQMRPRNNSDRMVYAVTKMLLQGESRLKWQEDPFTYETWYMIDKVGETRFLLFHGDQIRGGFAGFPWYGTAKKVQSWAAGAVKEPFDHAVHGHFHQQAMFTLNDIVVYVNGTLESGNVYAQEQLGSMGRPSQRLLFVHPRNGVSADYTVWLD